MRLTTTPYYTYTIIYNEDDEEYHVYLYKQDQKNPSRHEVTESGRNTKKTIEEARAWGEEMVAALNRR